MNPAGLNQEVAGTSLPGTRQLTSGMVALSLLALGTSGTAIDSRADISAIIQGTALGNNVQIQPATARPLIRTPAMKQIRDASQLSQRQWATILGVSHTTIRTWELADPPAQTRLGRVRDAVEQVRRYHSNVGEWLMAPLPGMAIRPADLLMTERYRAFRGALRAGVVAAPSMAADELRSRVRSDATWPIREAPSAPDGSGE